MALRCPVSGKTVEAANTAPAETVAKCPIASAIAQASHSPETAAVTPLEGVRCPVSGKTAAEAKTAPAEALAKCPVASAVAQAEHSSETAAGPPLEEARCPVSGKTVEEVEEAAPEAVAKCPVASAVACAGQSPELAAKAPQAAATCPYGFGSKAGAEASSGKEGAVCPMGFGSDSAAPNGPLAALQCTRCKALFFNPVKTACGHFFCQSCIANVQDCLLCGADVQDVHPETRLQELVDLYLEVDGNAWAFEERAALPKGIVSAGQSQTVRSQDDGDAARASKHAEFLEQLALRSLAGGNVEAAISRLGLCKDALLAEVSSSGYTSELSYRLGNVIGTQGTCLEQQGQTGSATDAYRESIEQLKKSPDNSEEAVQALAVSMNKLGDRQYLDKNLHGAKQHYTEALRIRQEFCHGAEPVSAELRLGIVISLLKVLDIEQALGETAAAQGHKKEAQDALHKAAETMPQAGPLRAKYFGLEAMLTHIQ